jgi:hypothetical protein
VAAQVVEDLVRLAPGTVEGGIVEHVPRAHEPSLMDLVAQADDPGWAVEPGWVCITLGDGHERGVVGAPHRPGNGMREREWLEHLAHGGESRLAAHDHHRVVLADVAAGHERQPLRAGGGRRFAELAGRDLLAHKPRWRPDVEGEVIELLGAIDEGPLSLHEVVDLERNPACIFGSITRPAVVNGSAKIRNSGRFQAPGSVLSARKHSTGSDTRSVKVSSA